MHEFSFPEVPLDWLGQPIQKGSHVVLIHENYHDRPTFLLGTVIRTKPNRIWVSTDQETFVFGLTHPDQKHDVIVVEATPLVAKQG